MSAETRHANTAFQEAFGQLPQVTAWAPGRLELLGNHTDYNLGEVLGITVDRGVWVSVRRRKDLRVLLRSGAAGPAPVEVEAAEASIPRRTVRAESWANYPLGVREVMRESGLALDFGFELYVESNLPAGAGMSSSAALEVATALALGALAGHEFANHGELVRLCRKAENEYVGMPCGILDQSVVVYGDRGRVVWINCATGDTDTLALPPGPSFWIFNTAEKHELIDSLYAERHRECMEACARLREALPSLEGLALAPKEALKRHAELLSPTLLARARHVVEENERVREARRLLQHEHPDAGALGRLMTASHHSSRTQFANSTDHLDFLVERLGRCPGIYGARLTGGGFGGAVLALADEAFSPEKAEAVSRDYEKAFGVVLTAFPVETGLGAGLR